MICGLRGIVKTLVNVSVMNGDGIAMQLQSTGCHLLEWKVLIDRGERRLQSGI